jgi:hypothetical protein
MVDKPGDVKENYFNYSIKEIAGIGDLIPDYKDVKVTTEEKEGKKVLVYNFTVINRSQKLLTISINKSWPQDGKYIPDEITVDVYRDKELFKTVNVTREQDWTTSIPEIKSVAPDGHLYSYDIKERLIDGFVTSIERSESDNKISFNIINTRRENLVSVKGTVMWKGDTGKESLRPETVILSIINSNDETVRYAIVLTDGDGTWEVKDLPAEDDKGNTISYHVKENDVEGYVESYADPVYDDYLKTYTCDVKNELGYFTFKIKKVIQGEPEPDDKDEVFRFHVSPYNDTAAKEMPKPSDPDPTITGEGEVVEELIIDKPGIYVYLVKELKGTKNYVYDEAMRIIIISMSIDESGSPSFKSWVRVVNQGQGSNNNPAESDVVTFVNRVIQRITYKLNGGIYNGSTDDIVEEHGCGSIIPIHKAPTREGYTFHYWQGSEYYPGDAYAVTGDHTFIAQWLKNPPYIPPKTGIE